FRDANDKIHLVASWRRNYALTGTSFDDLRLECSLIYKGRNLSDPSSFDDNAWLTSFYTSDGKTVFALLHNEYHGTEHPGACSASALKDCWINVITSTVSHDGGSHFEHPNPADQLIASLPYRYGTIPMPAGFFAPSNIVKLGSYYYVMVRT